MKIIRKLYKVHEYYTDRIRIVYGYYTGIRILYKAILKISIYAVKIYELTFIVFI